MSERTERLKEKLDGSEDSDILMMNILEEFKEVEWVPDPGNYYTFVYLPKTKGIAYDEHPLVAVTEIENWGFKGLNFHWGKMRNYTWKEVVGACHLVRPDEIDYLRSLPYAKYRINN